MRNAHRPMGRFFCLQLVMAAAAFVLLAERTHAAPPVSGPALTQVAETVYRADGTVAKGTVLISWPAFTTVDGKAVAAGSLRVPLGNGGAFAASLAPNTGAQPAGVYYRVVYQWAGPQPQWNSFSFSGGVWSPSIPQIGIGECFWVQSGSSTSRDWTEILSPCP